MDKEKMISTNDFRIEKNTISFNESLLQISNISHICAEPLPKPEFQLWSLGLCILGIIVLFATITILKVIGAFCICFGGAYIILYLFNDYNFNKEERYLYIYLNSGAVYYIHCENLKFLKKVIKVLEYCINNHSSQKIKIDFDNCKLYNSPVTVGDKNEVN